jgi:hypothetical protein
MKNYELKSLGDISTQSRIELHEQLKLTGTEISINELPANISIPFVHKHKENEEIYLVLEGICIQVKENSLDGFTQTDGIILENTHAFN